MDLRHAQVLSSHGSRDRGCAHRSTFFFFLDKQALVMQERSCSSGDYTDFEFTFTMSQVISYGLSAPTSSLFPSSWDFMWSNVCGHANIRPAEHFIE